MIRTLLALLFLCAALPLVPALTVAQEAEDEGAAVSEEEAAARRWNLFMQGIDWVRGPGTGTMGTLARLEVPEGHVFTAADGARSILEATGNVPDASQQGFVAPEGVLDYNVGGWWLVFSFDDIGYVENADDEEIDADELLETLRESTKAGNEERRRLGLTTLTLEGWARPPYYDKETKNLQWGTRLRSDDGYVSVNHNIKLLGRRGVMRAILVADPEEYEASLVEAKQLLTGYDFLTGETYGEYRKGDKVWKYGLTGLIAGGGVALAAKAGWLKHLWKFLVLIGAGIAAFFKKIFGGRQKNVYRPDDDATPSGDAPPA